MLAITGPQFVALIPSEGTVIQNNQVLHVAPHELTLRFDTNIDPNSLTTASVPAIQFTRGGDHVLGNGNDVTIVPDYYSIGLLANEVIARFDLSLPDDLYQVRIVGAGAGALKDINGKAFNSGQDLAQGFRLDLGAQVVSVVPQPVTRDANTGKLSQVTNEVDVYFNSNDPLDLASAQNTSFYELIRTGGTATPQDDLKFNPINVSYNGTTGKAVLIFNSTDITTTGTYRLRIGTSDPLSLAPTTLFPTFSFDNSSFNTASDLGSLFGAAQGTQTGDVFGGIFDGQQLSNLPGVQQITNPGAPTEPGGRDPQIESHVFGTPNTTGTIPVYDYNFRSDYGTVQGQPVFNLITDTQKQRVREALSYYAHYMGVEFVETASDGFTFATGDIRTVFPTGHPLESTSWVNRPFGSFNGEAVINSLDPWGSSEAGGAYFQEAMRDVGYWLGLGDNLEAPPLTIMSDPNQNGGNPIAGSIPAEPVFPGDLDLVYAKYLNPAAGNDINVYKFVLPNSGQLNLETIAERMGQLDPSKNPSQLDTVITLYDANHNIIARNDNYYGKDSFVQMPLSAGTYFVAVTSTGNTNFDPSRTDTGFGGTTQGAYQLRMTFTPTQTLGIKDTTGTLLDGDGDGTPGGVDNFWFKVDTAHTVFVDKAATAGTGALGSLSNPFTIISDALAAATPGSIVRIEGNGGADKNLATVADNLSYNIGFDNLNRALSDGTTFQIPRGVTVMVDAGAIIKLRGANVDVGSLAQGLDHSAGALQVLGTPERNAQGGDLGTVYFTSYYNNSIGTDAGTAKGILTKGNWGGLVFHDDSDLESAGIFLNYVNHANLSWGGGQVVVNTVLAVFDPIHMVSSRPTVSYNTIANSADSAMSADPNSFEESEFQSIASGARYNADYSRVGPLVHANTLTNNTINALFVRIRTDNGQTLDPLTVSARFANTDIVYVINEVLLIQGSTGGMIVDANQLQARPAARLAIDPGIVVKLGGARIETQFGATFMAEGTTVNPIIFTSMFDDRFGAGGNSDTTNDGSSTPPLQGNWGGFFFGPLSYGSIDHALIAYGGGTTTIEGGFDKFNAVGIVQAQVRLTNSTLDNNAAGNGGDASIPASNRDGRGWSDASVIFIRGAQPVILNNTIENSSGSASGISTLVAAISINVNALNSNLVDDWGRSRGGIDFQGSFLTNTGPLIRNNLVGNNDINGMMVRGGTVTTDVVWDDTDIVHVVKDAIFVPNQQSLSGTLRLQSSPTQSLVVKLYGTDTAITATGTKLDITDRIGGTVQIIGVGNHPVVLTSVKDDTVGAGLTPDGQPQKDTLNTKGMVPPPPPNLPTQGPIFIDGAPRDEHGTFANNQTFDGWNFIEHMVDYIFNASTITPASGLETTILAIGTHDLPGLGKGYSQQAIEHAAGRLGLTVQWVTGISLQAVNFNNYKMIYIPSDAETPLPLERQPEFADTKYFGGIADFDINILAKNRGGALLDYLNNRGGGLLALSEFGAAKPYEFLGPDNNTKFDPIITKHTGGNVLTATANAPPEWANYALGDNKTANFGLPWLVDFKGTAGFNRLQPMLVDPVTGEIEMLGLKPGGPGIGPPQGAGFSPVQDVPRPGDWNGVVLDTLSNDRNVALVNETEQGFSSAGDTNGTPSTGQFLGQLAKDLQSGDDNVRLGFEIHGSISQTTTSPGGGDVDVYGFTGTAGTDVWFDIDRTAPGLDSVVELVDANGSVIARSDNSLAESANPSLLVGIGQPLQPGFTGTPGPFTSSDFFASNPLDAGMRVTLPGTPGAVSTYFVRVRASNPSPNLADLAGGTTKGAYVLQVRLQGTDEFPGSTVQDADIRYAIDGVQVIGKPEHSPLTADTSLLPVLVPFLPPDPTAPVVAPVFQDLGNLISSSTSALTVSGNLLASNNVDVYKFEMGLDLHIGLGEAKTTLGALFQINYADGLSRPDATIAVYDSTGTLIMVGRDSDVADSQPRPGLGSDPTNPTHGSFGILDPTIGTVMLPTAPPGASTANFTYYVAVTSVAELPQALTATLRLGPDLTNPTAAANWNPLIRLEPIDSVKRVVEDHIGAGGGLATADPSQQIFPGSSASALNSFATPLQLGDVVLYVNTPTGLKTVDPVTGAVETTVGNLPTGSTVGGVTGYHDIAMRNDGRLFTLSQGSTSFNSGNYDQLSTVDGSIVSSTDDNLSTFTISSVTPATPTTPASFAFNMQPNKGIQFEAMAFLQTNPAQRQLFAIGNRSPDDLGGNIGVSPPIESVSETTNLLFELDPNTGQALHAANPVWDSVGDKGASATDFIPLGDLGKDNLGNTLGKITGMALLQSSALGTQMFVVTDNGGFYEVRDFQGARDSARVIFKSMTANVSFTGLTAGPTDVENGIYANTLFATDATGNLYAFDASGNLQPVFLNGVTHISTGITNAQGLAFSTLDYNLWHVTTARATDPGHGISPSFDNNILRDPAFNTNTSQLTGPLAVNNASFYFGLDGSSPGAANYANGNPSMNGSYALPGGAYGSLTSNPFSLAGYSSGDQPTLYFNYFLNTADINSNTGAADTLRVMASSDGVHWELLATNNVVPNKDASETPLVITPNGGAYKTGELAKQKVQPLFDNSVLVTISPDQTTTVSTPVWRQARIDLGDYAGQANIRLRFDFSTAGTMGSGSLQMGTGTILKALSGAQLHDGDQFKIDNTTFTFRSGFTLTTPVGGGEAIADGETFTINGTTFEFDKNGSVTGGNIAIPINATQSADDVAVAVAGATGYFLAMPGGGGTAIADGETFTINGKTFEFNKTGGVAGGNIAVPIIDGESAGNVTSTVFSVLQGNAAQIPGVTPLLRNGNRVQLAGATTVTQSVTHAVTIGLPVAGVTPYLNGNRIQFAGATTLAQSATPAVTLEGQAVPASPTSTDIIVNGGMSSADVAKAISQAMEKVFALNLVAPATGATGITDGETFTLNGKTFEFDKNGSVSGTNVPVAITNGQSANDVALAIAHAGGFSLTVASGGATISPGATLTINGTTFTFNKSSNVSRGNIAITDASTASGVALAIVQAAGFSLVVPNTGGAAIADGETFTINGHTFEFDKPGGITNVTLGNTAIPITATDSAAAVTTTIMGVFAANPGSILGVTPFRDPSNNRILLANATSVTQGVTHAMTIELPLSGAILSLNGSVIQLANARTVTTTTPAVTIAPPIAGVTPILNGDRVAFSGVLTFSQSASPAVTIVSADGSSSKPFTVAQIDGDILRIFGHAVTSAGPLVVSTGLLPGDDHGSFTSGRDRSYDSLGNLVTHEGAYIDDIIVGFASRGEMVTNAVAGDIGFATLQPATNSTSGTPVTTSILTGNYQLSIRRASSYGQVVDSFGNIALNASFDVNDRLAMAFTLVAQPAEQIHDGQQFSINDGRQTLTFEFDTNGIVSGNNVSVAIQQGGTATAVATAIRDAINLAVSSRGFRVRAGMPLGFPAIPTGARVDLFNAVDVNPGPMQDFLFDLVGDALSIHPEADVQGQTIIQGAAVSHSRQVGIQVVPKIGPIVDTLVDYGETSYFIVGSSGFAGTIANLTTLNSPGWVPGVTLENNLVVDSGRTGIEFGGSPNAGLSYAQNGTNWLHALLDLGGVFYISDSIDNPQDVQHFVPFGRIVNNTVFGAKNGIAAVNGSSPTIVNNILANTGVVLTPNVTTIKGAGVNVDASSGPSTSDTVLGSTVLGTSVYQNNVINADGSVDNVLGTADSNSIALSPGDPLFVDSSKGNFYLKEGSQAIDSSVNSVQDRGPLTAVTSSLGIPPSPIQAPQFDLLGQLRVDDPNVPSPPGFGSNVFKDRGAVERADFSGPTAVLINPVDNDAGGIDRNPAVNRVLLLNRQLTSFDIQLPDGVGVGVDDSTVDVSKFSIQRTVGNVTTNLTPGVDYFLAFDTNSKIAKILPSQGVWANGTYQINLDNSSIQPIKDLANNVLQPNEPSGATQFIVQFTDQLISPWQNPANKFDVNNDGHVSGLDALLIINRLLAGQGGVLPLAANVPPYIDVSGDGALSPLDALQVINFLNANPPSAGAAPAMATANMAAAPSAAIASDLNPLATVTAMGQPAISGTTFATANSAAALLPANSSGGSTASAAIAPVLASKALAATFESEETFDASETDLDSILSDLAGELINRHLSV